MWGNAAWNLLTQDMEKAETLNALFASVSTSQSSLQESQVQEMRGIVWSKRLAPGGQGSGQECLSKLDPCKSMDFDGMCLQVLRSWNSEN